MRALRSRGGLVVLTIWLVGATTLWACEDDSFLAPAFVFDASTGPIEAAAATVDAADAEVGPDPVDAADAADAAPPSPLDPFRGIWHGVGNQGGTTWTILTDIHGGPRGKVVGMMNYPSLACGGTLVFPQEDAGTDDLVGDGGLGSITLHESVSATCIQEGEDTFTLLADGTLFFEYRTSPTAGVLAYGTLTRVGASGAVSDEFGGVWQGGTLNPYNLRPLMVSISRDDTVDAPSGLFLVANANGVNACGGHWTLKATSGGALELAEVFSDGQIECDGPGIATLTQAVDTLTYARTIDGGAAFDGGDGVLSRF